MFNKCTNISWISYIVRWTWRNVICYKVDIIQKPSSQPRVMSQWSSAILKLMEFYVLSSLNPTHRSEFQRSQPHLLCCIFLSHTFMMYGITVYGIWVSIVIIYIDLSIEPFLDFDCMGECQKSQSFETFCNRLVKTFGEKYVTWYGSLFIHNS